ncbi:MAG: hypothetical protein U0974_01220 [Gemmatimonadales bacterium]|nr:hypothetical protein [Gemmatimonadales bacterium]MDZ4388336.1 hypothetical protein [Gemmatimonadales bacterium]
MSERRIAVVADVIIDPGTGRRLPDLHVELLRESLREGLRHTYRQLLAAGRDDAAARAALGSALALLIELDRLSGSVGDSLADTEEAD